MRKGSVMLNVIAIGVAAGILGYFWGQGWTYWRLVKTMEKRAIVAVVDTEGYLTEQETAAWEAQRSWALPVAAMLWGVNREELEGKSVRTLGKNYGEEWLGKMILGAGHGYQIRILIRNESTGPERWAELMQELAEEGLTTDVVVVARADENGVYLNGRRVPYEELERELAASKGELGVAYLSCCWGKEQAGMWSRLGAEAVAWVTEEKFSTVLAPAIYVNNWSNGERFGRAVGEGLEKERRIWDLVGWGVPEMKEWVKQSPENPVPYETAGHATMRVWD